MTKLASLVTAGQDKVGVLLPDTTSPARYVEFDAPLVTKAFTAAGLPSSDLSVQNAHGERDTGEKGAGRPTSPTVRPL